MTLHLFALERGKGGPSQIFFLFAICCTINLTFLLPEKKIRRQIKLNIQMRRTNKDLSRF